MSLGKEIEQLKGKKILVTGGAGFIGSNLVKNLVGNGIKVVVLDNLSTGKHKNIAGLMEDPLFSFIEGDITDSNACYRALEGVDMVCHQAALGSVPRSIEFPHNTHNVNATGFLNILHAAKEKGIDRFVYASSSSVYGDSIISPKTIGSEGRLLSPYAVTKQLNEMYAGVYSQLHNMETIGLRYFNVFGPNQDPEGVYAAAIPKFLDKMLTGDTVTINGDGEQTRDFTFVENAVKANVLALATDNADAYGNVYNVACGQYLSLNDVVKEIRSILAERGRLHADTKIIHGPDRPGDIRDSLADISATRKDLGYEDPVQFQEGIYQYIDAILNE